MNKLKSYRSKHLYDSMLPCLSWLVFCSVVSVQNIHFFSSKPLSRQKYRRKGFFRALISQEGDVDNEMPLGEEQDNSEI